MFHLRKRAVERVANGVPVSEVSQALGVSRTVVYNWMKRYEQGGVEALRTRPARGRPRKLDDVQLCRLYTMLGTGGPDHFDVGDERVWCCGSVKKLVERDFGVHLSTSSLSRIVRRLGVPSNRLLTAVGEHWLAEASVQAHALARPHGGTALVLGETATRWGSGDCSGSTNAASVTTTTAYAIEAYRPQHFLVYEGTPTTDFRQDFYSRVLESLDGPTVLVIDWPQEDIALPADAPVITWRESVRMVLAQPAVPAPAAERS
ncbi:helix-turn-helix domain-containing protein [Streptomyces sp. NPDC001514]